MTDELKYRIRFTRGTLAGQLFPLGSEPVILGRSHTCSIRLMEPDVSGRHVMLSVSPKGVGMEVISSRRTVLDGTALKTGDRVSVKAGQGVTMGGTASFEVECYLSDGDATEMPMGGELPTGFRDGGEPRKPGRGIDTANPEPATGSRTDPPSAAGMTGAKTKTSFRRKASLGDTTHPATMGTQAVPPPETGGETAGTAAFAAAGDATQVLRTRAATPQELAYMRSLHDRKRRKRLWLRLALGLCVTGIACGVYAWLALHAPEQTLSIPKPPKGRKPLTSWLVADAALNPAGTDQTTTAGLYLKYPTGADVPKTQERAANPAGGNDEATVSALRARVGRARDVPLQLKLVAYASDASLDQDREDSFAAWYASQKLGIEKQMALKTDFVGENPGIPCLRWTYRRPGTDGEREEGIDDWAGVLSFFRLRDTCFVYFREVPGIEELRAESLLLATSGFLGIAPGMVQAHWEGMDKARQYGTNLPALRNSANELMQKPMKTKWEETEGKLTTILVLTFRQRGNEDADRKYDQAQKWMKKLRESQEKAWKEARNKRWRVPEKDRDGKGRQLDEEVRTLFRSPDDRRTDWVRTKEKWWEE